jgi:mxaK protein
MGLISRRTTRIAWALLALTAAAAAVDATLLVRDQRRNVSIADGKVPAEGNDLPPQMRFAQAYALAHAQAASGALQAALNRYGALQDDTPLGQAARYNGANLLMRQAIEMRAGLQPGQALALIELAKEGYREVLRHDPGHWDARYNLERAQRLVPDPDEMDLEPPQIQRNAERAATTMRGYSPGLP